MSNCQIQFKYRQDNIIIQCNRNNLMKDIFKSYGLKSGLSIDEFFFLYGGDEINLEKTLSQLKDNAAEIQILVYPKNDESNENQFKKSTYIKCAECENLKF